MSDHDHIETASFGPTPPLYNPDARIGELEQHIEELERQRAEALAVLREMADAWSPDIVVPPSKQAIKDYNRDDAFNVGRNAAIEVAVQKFNEAITLLDGGETEGGGVTRPASSPADTKLFRRNVAMRLTFEPMSTLMWFGGFPIDLPTSCKCAGTGVELSCGHNLIEECEDICPTYQETFPCPDCGGER